MFSAWGGYPTFVTSEKMIGAEVDQLQLFWHGSSQEQQKMKAREKLEGTQTQTRSR